VVAGPTTPDHGAGRGMELVPGQIRLTGNRVGSGLRMDLVGETHQGSGQDPAREHMDLCSDLRPDKGMS
jgi:hypothetical protein